MDIYLAMDGNLSHKQQTVCVFGTGDFGQSLGKKMLQCGYSVVFGSRNPGLSRLRSTGLEVVSYAEAAQKSDLIIVAVHREHYNVLTEVAEELQGKILVDISNNLKIDQYPESNAEYLAGLVPGAKVVKAFNTISAWALQSGNLDANRQVFVCGDDETSKKRVMDIGSALGLYPLDYGGLAAAREIENKPLLLFPMWRFPFYLTVALVMFFLVYFLLREVIYPYVSEGKDKTYLLVISLSNHIFSSVALNLLALVYLPGLSAAILQLWRGTKYSRFPNWLDCWMRSRKQLGLIALALGFLHVMYSLVTPLRYSGRWKLSNGAVLQAKSNKTDPFDTPSAWKSDVFYALGILGFFLFVLLGITSLPSVSNTINWREFRFIQSKLGYCTLMLCTAHTLVFGGKKLLSPKNLIWYLPRLYIITLIIPCTVLVLKFILILPCFNQPLTRIQQGFERKSRVSQKDQIENGSRVSQKDDLENGGSRVSQKDDLENGGSRVSQKDDSENGGSRVSQKDDLENGGSRVSQKDDLENDDSKV